MIQSKLPNTAVSIFSSMGALVEETGAIDMANSKTDFPCSPDLIRLAKKYLETEYNNFSPVAGVMKLREAIAGRVRENYGYQYHPETEVTVTAGTIQAIHTAISAIVKDDDEVIVFEPAYEAFIPSIILNGGKPVYVQLKPPGFKVDWEELRRMVTSKTRMIIISSPHNPTGSVFSENDLLQLQRLTNGTNIIILSTEIYESIVFDNITHQSVARFEKLAERSFVVSSFGPLYNINGWGLAYCLAPERLMIEFRKIQRFQVYNANTPLQYAMADFLPTSHPLDDISELYQGKRNYFNRLMGKSLFHVIPAQGGYFQLLDYSKLSDEPDVIFAERLAREFGVATLPVSAFCHEKNKQRYLRICFAKTNETLEQAAARLLKVPSIL
ncbi:MAG: methionine aminotransferase [Prolixibacteraceae bacterium]